MTTRPTWTRTAAGRWTRENCAYVVCLNDSGRTFRIRRPGPDGALRTYGRVTHYQTLAGAQDVADAFAARDAAKGA